MLLSGCSSGSKAVKSTGTAPKVSFNDTEILKSSLLTRRGSGWALIASLDYATRQEVLGCDILLLSSDAGSNQTGSPFMRLMLVTATHPDTPVALRVTVGSNCYSFTFTCSDGDRAFYTE